jgi:doublecortin domain-containing protein 1
MATSRLSMNRAARRLFLESGKEIKNIDDFNSEDIVHISDGTDFIDPFIETKKILDKRNISHWTSDGIHFNSDYKANDTSLNDESYNQIVKPPSASMISALSKERLTKTPLLKRLVAYENGCEYDPCIAVLEVKNPLKSTNDHELDQINLSKFLISCSERLKMTSAGKYAYNWNGQLVHTINDIPKLDKCLQKIVLKDVEYGPVWISKGEGFDPRGPFLFMENLIKFLKNHRKKLKDTRKVLNKKLAELYEEKRSGESKSATTLPIRLSEAHANSNENQLNINELEESLKNLQEILNELNSKCETTETGSKLNHIKVMNTNDKLYGGNASRGLRLRAFSNATGEHFFNIYFNLKGDSNTTISVDAAKGTGNGKGTLNDQIGMHHLLTQITSMVHKRRRSSPATFSKVFTEDGSEVTSLRQLKNDQNIWISQGEPWIKPQTSSYLSLPLMSLVPFNDQSNNTMNQSLDTTKQPSNGPIRTFLEALNTYNVKKYTKPHNWQVVDGSEVYQRLCNSLSITNQSLMMENAIEIDLNKANTSISQGSSVNTINSNNNLFINCKEDNSIFLYPQLKFNKKQTVFDPIWMSEFQSWCFTEKGFIFNKFFKDICLAEKKTIQIHLDFKPKKQINNKSEGVEEEEKTFTKIGHLVTLDKKKKKNDNNNDNHQQWSFNLNGNITAKTNSNSETAGELVLTDISLLIEELNNGLNAESYNLQIKDSLTGEQFNSFDQLSLILLEPFDSKQTHRLATTQKWAIKQDNIGKSRHSVLSTPQWHKLAYTWPINEKGELIKELGWPITGNLISGN